MPDRRKWICLGWLAVWWCVPGLLTAAARELAVELEYPAFAGDFYADGTVSFPPGTVTSADQVLVKTAGAPAAELPTRITVLRHWPDGSILKAQILFPANVARRQPLVLAYGPTVQRTRKFQEPAVLPTVPFAVSGAPSAAETMDVNVGALNVRVDRSPGIYYYWHLLPILLIVGWTLRRSWRAARVS